MNPLFEAAVEVQTVCDREGWGHAVIGGLAVQRWGEPRLTRDVDLTVMTGFGGEADVIGSLLSHFEPRFEDAAAFALQTRVLLIRAANGIPLDVALGAMPFEARAVDRASAYAIGEGRHIRTCSAEDLVVLKAFADRPQDWLDIESVLARQADLDLALVRRELAPLAELKGEPEILDRLRQRVARARA